MVVLIVTVIAGSLIKARFIITAQLSSQNISNHIVFVFNNRLLLDVILKKCYIAKHFHLKLY